MGALIAIVRMLKLVVIAPILFFIGIEENTAGVIATCIFLVCWALVVWVVAMAWERKKSAASEMAADSPSKTSLARTHTTTRVTADAPPSTSPSEVEKICPFCAENILAAAIKCKHCGSPV